MYREASDAKGEFGKYLFTKNPQDDILKVYKDSGELAVEYLYDAWGASLEFGKKTVLGASYGVGAQITIEIE